MSTGCSRSPCLKLWCQVMTPHVSLVPLSPYLLKQGRDDNHELYFYFFKIFLHGNNLNSLHQLIHPECLPSEFGGTLPPYDMGTWARTLLGPDYSDENEYTHTSYNAMHVKHTSSNLEREASPKPMKRLVQLRKLLGFWLALEVGCKSGRKGSSGSERGCR